MTITEFLLARIAEDEAVARDAAGWDKAGQVRAEGRWSREGIASIVDDQDRSVVYSDSNQVDATVADHIALHDPARVLAECEAKRRIVELHHERDVSPSCATCGGYTAASDERSGIVHHGYAVPWPCPTLLALASVYADHPDFDPVWR